MLISSMPEILDGFIIIISSIDEKSIQDRTDISIECDVSEV